MTRSLEPVLVVGAGIAGIQAALDLAEAGVPVVLVEREAFVGGNMARLDKTFPTLDCSSCTLTPRTSEVARHPNIRLLTRTDLVGLEERGRGFRARLRIRPRFVDPAACTACGRCAEACRLRGRVPSRFDLGLSRRSAIDLPFPQAVPAAYAVDPGRCLFLSRGRCGRDGPRCVAACGTGAVRLDETPSDETLDVSAVVVAVGYDPYRPDDPDSGRPELGYGTYPGVITNLQFERLAAASGPTGGEIRVAGGEPGRVVFLQCVGSRDRTTGAVYCSRVCCMASVKHALLVLEKIPGAEPVVLYMDLRCFGRGYEGFLERAGRAGVVFRRGNPAEVYRRGARLVVRFEDTLLGRVEELEADLVVLAAGLRPAAGLGDLARVVGLRTGSDGFLEPAATLDPARSARSGVFLAGACLGPMDIPDAVASGSAAASAALAHVLGRADP